MRIVFMGTPAFAVPTLKVLHEQGYDIVGVITSTDKMGGRGGKKLLISDVKKYAVEHNLKVLQPKNLKAPSFLQELKALKADLQVVIAFRMLPVVVWDMPPLGTINLHGSLLPAYRGAAPINWAVINGETITGVTSFQLKHAIDTGDIILQEKVAINPEDTAGDLHDKMMEVAAQTVLRTVQIIEKGDVTYTEQDETKVSKAPKIFREDCEIDFTKKTEEIKNFVRGLAPYPGAFCKINGTETKVYSILVEEVVHDVPCGNFYSDNKSYIKVFCKDGIISLEDVKFHGKKRMPIRDFLNGNKLELIQK